MAAKRQSVTNTDLLVSAKVAAEFFGVSEKCVRTDWCQEKGCPKASHGVYSLKALFDWWQQNIAAGGDSEEMAGHKVRYWKAMADGKEIDNRERTGKLIPADEVHTAWAMRVAEVKQGLLSLPLSLPPVLAGQDQDSMRAAIRKAVIRLLESYSSAGRHCKPATGRKPARKPTRKKARR